CSLQRRHQKVIEEAPAPGMDEATREDICAAAVRAAKAVDYEGAGTIEFIADASKGLRADRIFFMEMNTRLQVEHPVTEEITGVDLVEWQLRVANGEPIPLKQEDLSIDGWAIEARLYAEDPAKGFLPSIGRLEMFSIDDGYSRIETGVEQYDEISSFYDPMIAKLVVHADDRESAIWRMEDCLEELLVHPVKTNAPFLLQALTSDEFEGAMLDTGLIERNPEWSASVDLSQAALDQAAISFLARRSDGDTIARNGFRLNAPPRTKVAMTHGTEVVVGDAAQPFDGVLQFDDGETVWVNQMAETFALKPFETRGTGSASAADGAILAPMPGKVIAVDVAEGDSVTAGQRLMVLEAMKMEHALTAPFDGTVTELNASEGGQVQVEAVLCVVEPSQ
uniref:ATP-binding protein n=1 Tax=Qipengyuania sp. TaxID=2004515 RepID=UPI0035C794BF